MSLLMMLAASGRRDPITVTFTANATWTAPSDAQSVDLSGKGGRGSQTQSWRKDIIITYFRRDGGPNYVISGGNSTGTGPMPADYCDAVTNYTFAENPTYFASQVCYHYVDTSSATAGPSATGFGKTFPGSTGDVAPTVTQYAGVAVTPGQTYSLVVPSGGFITITY